MATASGCAWEVALEDDSVAGCERVVGGWLKDLLEWATTVDSLAYVTVPVQFSKTPIYFVPRSRATLRDDSRAFCVANQIHDAGCAEQLEDTATKVYSCRRTFLSPKTPAVLCPRHRHYNGPCHPHADPPCPGTETLLVAFWHIAALNNDVWAEIVREQLATLQESGLLSTLHWTSVHVVGPRQKVEDMMEHYPSIHVSTTNHSTTSFEFETLAALQQHCKTHPTSWVMYFHNKGASRAGPGQQRFVRAWRHYLEEFVLRRFRSCLAVLQAGYDTCGVQWADDWMIYGGNFWWARCEYINTLPDVQDLPRWLRHISENWIGTGKRVCPVSCYYASLFLYDEELDPQAYRNVSTGCDALLLHSFTGQGPVVPYHELHVKAKRPASRTDAHGHALPTLSWKTATGGGGGAGHR